MRQEIPSSFSGRVAHYVKEHVGADPSRLIFRSRCHPLAIWSPQLHLSTDATASPCSARVPALMACLVYLHACLPLFPCPFMKICPGLVCSSPPTLPRPPPPCNPSPSPGPTLTLRTCPPAQVEGKRLLQAQPGRNEHTVPLSARATPPPTQTGVTHDGDARADEAWHGRRGALCLPASHDTHRRCIAAPSHIRDTPAFRRPPGRLASAAPGPRPFSTFLRAQEGCRLEQGRGYRRAAGLELPVELAQFDARDSTCETARLQPVQACRQVISGGGVAYDDGGAPWQGKERSR